MLSAALLATVQASADGEGIGEGTKKGTGLPRSGREIGKRVTPGVKVGVQKRIAFSRCGPGMVLQGRKCKCPVGLTCLKRDYWTETRPNNVVWRKGPRNPDFCYLCQSPAPEFKTGGCDLKALPESCQVKYLSERERVAHRLIIADGRLFRVEGTGLRALDKNSKGTNGWLFVMDAAGDLYAGIEAVQGQIHHSTILAGKPVRTAGWIGVEKGRLKHITNNSGHYHPSCRSVSAALAHLKEMGLDTTGVEQHCHAKSGRSMEGNVVCRFDETGAMVDDKCLKKGGSSRGKKKGGRDDESSSSSGSTTSGSKGRGQKGGKTVTTSTYDRTNSVEGNQGRTKTTRVKDCVYLLTNGDCKQWVYKTITEDEDALPTTSKEE